MITRGVGYAWWERKKERKEDRSYWKPKGLCPLCTCAVRSAHIVTLFLETRVFSLRCVLCFPCLSYSFINLWEVCWPLRALPASVTKLFNFWKVHFRCSLYDSMVCSLLINNFIMTPQCLLLTTCSRRNELPHRRFLQVTSVKSRVGNFPSERPECAHISAKCLFLPVSVPQKSRRHGWL